MANVRIFTDSAADLPQEIIKRHNIGVVPILVTFDDQSYADGVDLEASKFYRMMAQSTKLPVTSQPSPADFMQAFAPDLAAGTEIVTINLSSGLSGTLESALLAKEALDDQGQLVAVVDSHAASLGQGLLVLLAAELAQQGRSAADIVLAVQTARGRLKHMFTLDTMDNLIKGGRIGRAKGAIGNLLNIKPILFIDDNGKIDMLEKARGRKKSLKYLLDSFSQQVSVASYPYIGICHADCLEEAQVVAAKMQQLVPSAQLIFGNMGAAIGTHVARGCIAIFFFGE